ncbi:TonB-dependent receptor [Marinihelvus fidelis]|uniref:TonB-dependent receptor n=1 Tax=Marinihelvus fidelis TaxID=2613842 RepID=A0A5N0T613_9GAMM|nr:TonB-dependent receptor [Marinihelvus fidelis]KAA9130302.1 TonB-dependent receptor [Marinihelvus fidelis]
MYPNLNCVRAACLLSGFFVLGAQAQVNEPDDEAPLDLGETVVTAALTPLAVNDVAASVTIITREQIEQKQARYLSDLLRDVPGFAVSQSGGPGALTQVRVRGTEANQLLVLIDGIRANDPAGADEFQFAYALTDDIERIEIVRGPQSATWGSDAVGAVVNIIRRRDRTGSWVNGRAEGGSFGTVDLAASGGFSAGATRVTAGVSHYDTDGTNISRQGDEKDGSTNTTADLGVDVGLGQGWALRFTGRHVEAENEFDGTDFVVTGLPIDGDQYTEAERNYLSGEARFEPADSRWSGNAFVGWTDTDNQNYAFGAWDSATGAEVLEARLRGSVLLDGAADDQQHRLSAGIDRIDSDFSQRGIDYGFGNPNQDQSTDQTGYQLEYIGQLFEGFTWTASGRYDDFSDWDAITTWKVAASHQVTDIVRARGSVGTGFKAPTFTERFGFYPDQFIGNPGLVPEESTGWEVGLEARWLDGDLGLDVAWFDQVLENEIDGFVFDPDTFLYTAANRDADSDRSGLEVVFDAAPLESLLLDLHYTYLDASEDLPGGGTQREVRRPRHQAGLTANWAFGDGRGNLNLDIDYTGEQYDVFYDPATFVSSQVKLDAYTVVDLAASWRLTRSLELIGRVDNLGDEDYEEVYGYTRPGRAFYGGLRGRFDF